MFVCVYRVYLKNHRMKIKEGELARELKIKTIEPKGDDDSNDNWWTRNSPQMFGKGAGSVGNKRMNRDHRNYSIVKICENTEKSPGDLRRLADPQTPFKNHQLTLVWINRKT